MKEFEKVYQDRIEEIKTELKQAEEAVTRAEKLSEKYGIPFETDIIIGFTDTTYIPKSFKDKWQELDIEDGLELVKVDYPSDPYGDYGIEDGWAHEGWSSSSLFC
jgi:hypothetical protein